jgi:hypothetical protein
MPREPQHSRHWGGRRSGSGRPVGAKAKYSKEEERKAWESGEHPVDFMLGIMRDTANDMKMRMHACHAVLPYVAARLNAVDINVTSDLDTMTLSEKLDRVTSLRTGIMEQRPDLQLPQIKHLNGSAAVDVVDGELVDD